MHQRSALSPRLTAELADLGTRVGPSDHELAAILAELAALPAHLVVRASREIATAARLGWWQPEKLPRRVIAVSPARARLWWFMQLFEPKPRRVASDRELLEINRDYAWLFLFHPDGYLREAALDRINDPPTSPFFFAALAWRLNDWVPPVRLAAQRCAERVLPDVAVRDAAGAAPYLLNRRTTWGRWSSEPRLLDNVFERDDVMAALALQFRESQTGALATRLRHCLRYPSIDQHLPQLAAAAVAPAVRAVAYQCLISGKAVWPVGFEWAWIDKVHGLRRRVPKLATRDIPGARSAGDLIREAAHDKSFFVRRVAADALVTARAQLSVEAAEALIAQLEKDRSPAIRSRADYMRRHPLSGQPP